MKDEQILARKCEEGDREACQLLNRKRKVDKGFIGTRFKTKSPTECAVKGRVGLFGTELEGTENCGKVETEVIRNQMDSDPEVKPRLRNAGRKAKEFSEVFETGMKVAGIGTALAGVATGNPILTERGAELVI